MRNFPVWLTKSFSPDGTSRAVQGLLSELNLESVCEHASCPNRQDCYSNRQLTFMILGRNCTRACRFCAVSHGLVSGVDLDEPMRLAEAANRLGLSHVVVTSVTRDDLADEGASHFVRVVEALKKSPSHPSIELLVPDFHARKELIEQVISSSPDVFAHNIETVERLSGSLRPQAGYRRSLDVLRLAASITKTSIIKSGIMVGLGETCSEVKETLKDLFEAGCTHVTIGQYLRPSSKCVEVAEYVSPSRFLEFRDMAYEIGFSWAASSPFVRSSYRAFEALKARASFKEAVSV